MHANHPSPIPPKQPLIVYAFIASRYRIVALLHCGIVMSSRRCVTILDNVRVSHRSPAHTTRNLLTRLVYRAKCSLWRERGSSEISGSVSLSSATTHMPCGEHRTCLSLTPRQGAGKNKAHQSICPRVRRRYRHACHQKPTGCDLQIPSSTSRAKEQDDRVI